LSVVRSLANGVDPETGEVFAADSVYQRAQTVRALYAAAEALESLKRPVHVIIHTDSQYLKNGITRWMTGWVRKGWRGSTGDPVANIDLWQRILKAQEQHRVEWKWVRGHDGNDMNERADQLATEARRAAFGRD
jgi:ribonuclease HI